MGVERKRFDPSAVEAARYIRKRNLIVQAAEIAATEMGSLHPDQVTAIARDPEQRSVLACLAQLHIDAQTSVANRSFSPRRVLRALEGASGTISTVHQNEALISQLYGVTTDHRGEEFHFAAELPRGYARVLFSAMPFYKAEQRQELFVRGEQLLQQARYALPEDHPSRSLIGIELQFFGALSGKQIDEKQVLADFANIKKHREDNPERFITVASWLVHWGSKLGEYGLHDLGIKELYDKFARDHTELDHVRTSHRFEADARRWQMTTFGLLAPTTNATRREKLHSSLLKYPS